MGGIPIIILIIIIYSYSKKASEKYFKYIGIIISELSKVANKITEIKQSIKEVSWGAGQISNPSQSISDVITSNSAI